MQTQYEWDVETVDQYGDIIDHSHGDTPKDCGFPLDAITCANDANEFAVSHNVLVLVRDVGDQWEGLQDRTWAYAYRDETGALVLPSHMEDSGGRKCAKIPAKYHRALRIWQGIQA